MTMQARHEPMKTALITGAGSGIGRAAALALAKDGFITILAGRRLAPLQDVAQAITQMGAEALALVCDVSEAEQVDHLFAQTKAQFGRLDLLFNNAGLFAPSLPIDEIDPKNWREIVDVNLTGAFLCTQASFRLMKSQTPRGGRIINNGSISAHVPRPNSAPYAATKHAMTGLTKASALDGRAYDIACGQIDIGNAETQMTDQMKRGMLQADGSRKPEAVMDLDNVARAISYMASLPLEANVQFMTVMATKMPYIGRG